MEVPANRVYHVNIIFIFRTGITSQLMCRIQFLQHLKVGFIVRQNILLFFSIQYAPNTTLIVISFKYDVSNCFPVFIFFDTSLWCFSFDRICCTVKRFGCLCCFTFLYGTIAAVTLILSRFTITLFRDPISPRTSAGGALRVKFCFCHVLGPYYSVLQIPVRDGYIILTDAAILTAFQYDIVSQH